MEINEAQKNVKEILKDIEHPRLGSFIALTEEVGEVANEIMKLEIYNENKEIKHLKEEIADVMFQLFDLANSYNINLENEFLIKLENIKPRAEKWRVQFKESMRRNREKLD